MDQEQDVPGDEKNADQEVMQEDKKRKEAGKRRRRRRSNKNYVITSLLHVCSSSFCFFLILIAILIPVSHRFVSLIVQSTSSHTEFIPFPELSPFIVH